MKCCTVLARFLATLGLILAAATVHCAGAQQLFSAGVDYGAFAALDARIAHGDFEHIDHLLVTHCGATVFERDYRRDYRIIYGEQAMAIGPLNPHGSGEYDYFDAEWHPYFHHTVLHTLQSVTKSVTSTVWGVAITRGDFKAPLDTPVLHYFDEKSVKNVDDSKRRMTLQDLLTMSSGLEWDEELAYDDPRNSSVVMEASDDWVQYVIDRPMSREPGTAFNYSSGNTELLSYIFLKETGQDMEKYAEVHLFAPLDIKNHHWKRTPMGVIDTEGGLFLSAPDLAKIGQLFLQDGKWNGQRLVSSKWIGGATTGHMLTDRLEGGVRWKYGYQWWLKPHPGTVLLDIVALGFGGQLLYISPTSGIVLVVNGWTIFGREKRAASRSAIIDQVLGAIRAEPCH